MQEKFCGIFKAWNFWSKGNNSLHNHFQLKVIYSPNFEISFSYSCPLLWWLRLHKNIEIKFALLLHCNLRWLILANKIILLPFHKWHISKLHRSGSIEKLSKIDWVKNNKFVSILKYHGNHFTQCRISVNWLLTIDQ